MNAIKENAGSLLLPVAELLIGMLLLVNPVGFTAGIVIAVGALLLACGPNISNPIREKRFPSHAGCDGNGCHIIR